LKHPKRFTSEQRIRGQDAFKNLVEKGRFSKGRFFYLWAGEASLLVRKTSGKPMLGVVVNKKTQASAVKRNLIKRRVREVFRSLQDSIHPETAVLIKAKETSTMPGLMEIREDLATLFKKVGISL
jgi:ribonuclease P protein component